MNTPDCDHFVEQYLFALEAVRQAAILAGRLQRELAGASQAKPDGSPVTVGDFAAQAILCRALQANFSTDPIIAEERSAALRAAEGAATLDKIVAALASTGWTATGEEVCRTIDAGATEDYSDRFWTIDPIDGTLGFVRGDQFAVCLALIERGEVKFGVLGCPRLPHTNDPSQEGVLLFAARGQGAWEIPLDNANPGTARPIRVSGATDPQAMRFCESVEASHNWRECTAAIARRMGIAAPPVRIDSQAKYGLVARGDCEIYFRVPIAADRREKVWDHAAGVLLVEEAGGRVTDLDGRPLEFQHGLRLSANRGLLATNGLLHNELLDMLREIGT